MALSAKLHMRQSQALVMTPQLMQSIRLLQMPHAELERFIDAEIERNPLLERGERPADAGPSQDADGAAAQHRSAEAMAARLDSSLENVFPDDPGRREALAPALSAQWKSVRGGGVPLDGAEIADATSAAPTLAGHVGEQIGFTFADPERRRIAAALADALDEAGYLTTAPDEIAAALGTQTAAVEAVLETCRGFDPPGLFARDLADCLALQLAARDRLDPAMRALLGRLDLLARRDFRALERLCGVGEEDLVDMLGEIRALDPKPGAAFSSAPADAVVPDVLVRAAADGSWAVELNPDTLPRLVVDQVYAAAVSRGASQHDRQFVSDCLQSANWLTRSLDQRARTILKVASEIVRCQDAFLVHGVAQLRPLNLRMVADAIGMHESTVSRVTAGKYMLTPRGTFELRYFFSSAIADADGGDAHSGEAVRARIRRLIEAEPAGAVLSDDAIVAALRRDGVDIARRTVAKYREALGIASSVHRRREKRALARAGAA
ncbi:RNA polymerase factor sigma-54 [Aquibium sp. A9E412]|uniref:RNA polymerase factor sigma-54 n=1 Tax=Aquibium sp. A9E412 TaxID=2976767 RepID=UPI0025AF94C9|nr:RNA polymerase factor sigma-54 [Aquibium sp. A9E412]MDN2568143.1 RNA polymerase factor sigma-54 [Aquibium sp. A9E412]